MKNTVLLAFSLSLFTSLLAAPRPDEPWKRNAPITGAYDKALAVKCVNGTFVGKLRGNIIEHLGIPYAVQPIGMLRWTEPQLAPADDGVYEAYDYGPRALQAAPRFGGAKVRVPVGEDCLVLNVYRRADAPKGPLPVMVWIHGGGWLNGSGSDADYDGQRFLKDVSDVVLVTINYRLGVLGYAPGLGAAAGGWGQPPLPEMVEKYRASANLGLLDAACAFKWVKRNIAGFGGDPENITAFGESAGAGQTALLPFAAERGSVHKFIIQSGSLTMPETPEFGCEATRELFAVTGTKDIGDLLKLSTEQIRAAMGKVGFTAFPSRDGVVLPKDIFAAYPEKMRGCRLLIGANDRENAILPLLRGGFRNADDIAYRDMMGFVAANTFEPADWKLIRTYFSTGFHPELTHADKTKLFIGDVFFRQGVIRHAEIATAAGIPTYVYLMRQPLAGHPDIGCCHGTDLAYIFENPDYALGYTPFLKKERPTEKLNAFNSELSREMRQMWVAFAKTGDPSTPAHAWTCYNAENRPTMILGPETGMANDPDGDFRKLLAPMIKYSRETSLTHGGLMDAWHVTDDILP